jgi:hypothetical protein
MTGWVCPELVNLQQAADRLAAACLGRGACGYGKQAFRRSIWQCPARYDRRMAYDEDLAARIRDLIGPDPDLTEKKMFGGLAFLIRGTWQSVPAARAAC